MDAVEALKTKRKQLAGGYEEVENGAILGGLIFGCIFLTFAWVALWMGVRAIFPGMPENVFDGVGITGSVITVLAGVFAPAFVVPHWIKRPYDSHYRFIWRYLKHTNLAELVIDDTAAGQLYDVMHAYPWLKWFGSRRPRSLDERIEFASDYWQAMLALARGEPRRLRTAVRLGSFQRLADDATQVVFNGCLVVLIMAMAASVLLFPVLIPLCIVMLISYLKQQATQAALMDYFLDDPQISTSQLEPPAGLGKQPRPQTPQQQVTAALSAP